MRKGRIDYRMARRAVIRDVIEGSRTAADVCDAHPELVRAGSHIGEPSQDVCPICSEDALANVTYIFTRGGPRSGRAVPRATLREQLDRHGECNVFTVEVCLECHWHHLIESFWLVAGREAAV